MDIGGHAWAPSSNYQFLHLSARTTHIQRFLENLIITLTLSFLMPLFMVLSLSNSVIRIGKQKGLVAKVSDRSSHEDPTPCVGGIPIMIAILFSSLIVTPTTMWGELQFILAALLIVFLVGLRDDIKEMSYRYKMVGQMIAIAILVTKGGVRLESFYGLFYQYGEFPAVISILVSGFTLLVISNAFNLIDGINGLAGTVGTIICCTFGVWFFMVDQFYLGILAMAAAGSLLAFLRFNMKPARTFMGDSGALVIGLLIGVLAIKFIDIASTEAFPAKYRFSNPVAICMGILVLPLFDTIRVFITRLLRRKSPFKPDRRHIHHLLIDSGLEHLEATAILGIANFAIISLVYGLDPYFDGHALIALILLIALVATFFLHRYVVRRKNRTGNMGLSQPKT